MRVMDKVVDAFATTGTISVATIEAATSVVKVGLRPATPRAENAVATPTLVDEAATAAEDPAV
jgi:hypothetical protein